MFLRVQKREFRISLFDLICCCQVNILSKVKPKYLTVSDEGIGILFTETRG